MTKLPDLDLKGARDQIRRALPTATVISCAHPNGAWCVITIGDRTYTAHASTEPLACCLALVEAASSQRSEIGVS